MPAPLPAARRSDLRSQAHKLSPVVQIGDKGLTDEVVAEIDRSLKAHELIKVKAATDDRDARAAWMKQICERLEAHPVQQIGKVLVIYRENPKEKTTRSPSPSAKGEGSIISRSPSPRGEEKVIRSGRPRSRTTSPRPASEPRRRRPRTSR
jgi:RNA-binding protein